MSDLGLHRLMHPTCSCQQCYEDAMEAQYAAWAEREYAAWAEREYAAWAEREYMAMIEKQRRTALAQALRLVVS